MTNNPSDDLSDISISGDDLVLVLEKCADNDLDTVVGCIKVINYNVPDPLELCLHQAYLDTWVLEFMSYGGYTPTGGIIDVYQGDVACKRTWMGAIDLSFTGSACQCPETGCACMKYETTFTVIGDPIMLDSNHVPDQVCEDPSVWPFNCWECDVPCGDLKKHVDLEYNMDWEGCPCPDQSFKVILAQKSCS